MRSSKYRGSEKPSFNVLHLNISTLKKKTTHQRFLASPALYSEAAASHCKPGE
jgi:hypothetical protein